MSKAHARGLNRSYTFHSFVTSDPPGLSAPELDLRNQLRELERTKVDLMLEREGLQRQLQDIEEQMHSMCVCQFEFIRAH